VEVKAAARAVNMVWNHCNGAQRHALKHNTKWPTTGQLQRLTAGAGRLIGIPAQTVQRVCEEYIDRRRGSRKAKLRRRGKRSLGWVPFKNQTVRVVGSIVHFNGRKVRLWLAPRNRGTHQVRVVLAGCPRALVLQHRDRVFAQAAR
jgi:hypothetical protein